MEANSPSPRPSPGGEGRGEGEAENPCIVSATLTDKEWDDEMHLTSKGFQKIAALFQDGLLRTFPKLSQN